MENPEPPKEEQTLESAPTDKNSATASSETTPATPGATPGATDSAAPQPEKKPSLFSKIREAKYLYVSVFGVLILVIAAVSYFSVKGDKADNANPTASTLTANNLASLKGATTVVGDPKQILDIQSNAVFEGQILVRGELNAAGDLKVGKDLSVAGVGNFNTLQTTGNAAVSGGLTVKANLGVSGSGSFGSLSTGQLTAGGLTLNGDLALTHHLTIGGSIPKVTSGSIGSGGTATISGSDTSGTVTINTGSGATAGTIATITFSTAYKSVPHVVITPVGASAAGLGYYVTRTASGFTINVTNDPTAGSSFSFDYIIIG